MADNRTTQSIRHLQQIIANALASGQTRLPTICEMAAQAKVSSVTMRRAVALVRAQGIIAVSPGSGITVQASARHHAPELSQQSVPAVPIPHWQQIAREIDHAIQDGSYDPGAFLPKGLILQERYGCNFRTMRKALNLLAEVGRLSRCKRRYLVPVRQAGKIEATLVIIGAKNQDGEFQRFTVRTRHLLNAFEHHCSKSRLRIELIPYYETLGKEHTNRGTERTIRRLRENRNVVGFVVLSLGIPQPNLAYLLTRLKGIGQPIALLDESGTVPKTAPSQVVSPGVFSVAFTAIPGETVGRFLAAKGHRKVVYVSPQHDSLWSRNRFAGLERVFKQTVAESKIYQSCSPGAKSTWDIVEEQRALSTYLSKQIMGIPVNTTFPASLTHRVTNNLASRVEQAMVFESLQLQSVPLFERALEYTDATAWVAANDDVAVCAANFLTSRAFTVERDISIVGFDNSPESFTQSITTYSFNESGLAREMINYVLSPTSGLDRRRKALAEIRGFVIERDSVKDLS